ncbi:hypothetical protein AADZ84_13155 [Colwelliaceae bacterium MEBiC 14330]
MKFIKVFISTITMFFFIYNNSASADPWHGYTKITSLYPAKSGYIFTVESALPTHSTCGDGKRFSIPINHVNYEAMVSTLITAFVADKEIRINLDNITEPNCQPTINRFTVKK